MSVDASYNNLAPFTYGTTEQAKIDAGEKVFPHIFGTDSQGRDYFIRIVYGARISLAVGFFASIIVLIIGMTVGSISGYCGGKVDLVIMRFVDIIYSLPDMLLIILLASALKQTNLDQIIQGTVLEKIGANIISLFIVFAVLYWVSMSRLIRGQILALREQEYVLASQAAGAGGKWIIFKHLVPNCISVVIISTALQIPSAIFTESYLSFLGLGVNAPMPSLGSLASDALNGVNSYPFRLIIPAAVISLIVLYKIDVFPSVADIIVICSKTVGGVETVCLYSTCGAVTLEVYQRLRNNVKIAVCTCVYVAKSTVYFIGFIVIKTECAVAFKVYASVACVIFIFCRICLSRI